ncbi:hypothetical protein DNTS_029282 [Danionella cerebrum]|uniref:WW domain binding protein 1-like b n=1 Tax=Danionella cerebrum TaxID=2873325 RepID=A0A553QQU5_9TELE|nr:hypothetical protein DNTS_029282 [Danionella translucida]
MQLLHCEGVNNKSYVCETGHCCGESQCCSYYYELWWFWLVWAVIFLLSFCCVCHHRRSKHRLQQQQRQHEINLIAYREVHNYTSLPFYFRFLPNYLLPEYDEVVHRPATPPPPYSALSSSPPAYSSPVSTEQQDDAPCNTRLSTPIPPEIHTQSSREVPEEICEKDDNKPEIEIPQNPQSGDDKASSADQQKHSIPQDEDRILRRHRRFTGDSGIELCVCGRGFGSHEPKEFEGLLSEVDQEVDAEDFCEECGLPSYEEEHQLLLSPEHSMECGASSLLESQAQPVCVYLHTINEQEGLQTNSSEC